MQTLADKLIVVRGDDELAHEAADNAALGSARSLGLRSLRGAASWMSWQVHDLGSHVTSPSGLGFEPPPGR